MASQTKIQYLLLPRKRDYSKVIVLENLFPDRAMTNISFLSVTLRRCLS